MKTISPIISNLFEQENLNALAVSKRYNKKNTVIGRKQPDSASFNIEEENIHQALLEIANEIFFKVLQDQPGGQLKDENGQEYQYKLIFIHPIGSDYDFILKKTA